MENTQRLGGTMRQILVVLNATQGTHVTTARLAVAVDKHMRGVQRSLLSLVNAGLVRDAGSIWARDWQITAKGIEAIEALWDKESGA